jgi:hypothetical protein
MSDNTHPIPTAQDKPVSDAQDRPVKCCHCRKDIEAQMIAYLDAMTVEWEKLNKELLAMPSNEFGLQRVEPKLCLACRNKWERCEIGKDSDGIKMFKPRKPRKTKAKRPEMPDVFAEPIKESFPL